MSDTPTPRTLFAQCSYPGDDFAEAVTVEFAQQLERELAAAHEALSLCHLNASDKFDVMEKELAAAREEITKLKAAYEESLGYQNTFAKELELLHCRLGFKRELYGDVSGDDITERCVQKIRDFVAQDGELLEAREELARLKALADEMAASMLGEHKPYCGRNAWVFGRPNEPCSCTIGAALDAYHAAYPKTQ